MRLAPIFVLTAAACAAEPMTAPDARPFVLPDGGEIARDATVEVAVDAGPFECADLCGPATFCGCLGADCGCLPVAGFGEPCDPEATGTCAEGLTCVRAREQGRDVTVCSDGRPESSCSKTQDICQTVLGCVCLTRSTGSTHCACLDEVDPESRLCDRQIPETCPGGTCVRATAPGGVVFFVCSQGMEGEPCERGDGSCRTSLGCTCPLIGGRERCQCSEPGGLGDACDPRVPGSCVGSELVCAPDAPGPAFTTVCVDTGEPGLPCDPGNPATCPPGMVCVEGPNGFVCETP